MTTEKRIRDLSITAYKVYDSCPPILVNPAVDRPWMDQTYARHAYRCLPLLMANQIGWILQNPAPFACWWNGGPEVTDLIVRYDEKTDPASRLARSHFGHGILTFTVPYLFRTSEGYNLWVRGPTNYVKDAICPLDGIVESDWSPATFTMNWKIVRGSTRIEFMEGEPFAMLAPIPRFLPERFDAIVRPIADDQELEVAFKCWSDSRERFNAELAKFARTDRGARWQKHYFQGRSQDGPEFPEHQTRIDLAEFRSPDPNAHGG